MCLSIRLEFDNKGLRRKSEFFEGYVYVKANLTYEYVDERLEEKDPYWTGMLELGNILRKRFQGLNVETIRLLRDSTLVKPAIKLTYT